MKLKVYSFIFSLLLLAPSFSSFALCDFHDGTMFGSYARNYPQNFQRHSFSTPKASVKHPRFVTSEVNLTTDVEINYSFPSNYKNVTLTFKPDPDVTLNVDKVVKIEAEKGQFTLPIKSAKKGEYIITVLVEGTKNTLPYSLVQEIDFSVY